MDIEMRVDFGVWHSPIAQLNLHEYLAYLLESDGGLTRLAGRSPDQHLVGVRAIHIDRFFHCDTWANRHRPAFQKRDWNRSREQEESQ